MLGIFPEDVAIPIDVLATLWGASISRTKKLCRRLADVSLVLAADATGVRLHDVIRKYLRDRLGETGCGVVAEGLLVDTLASLEAEKNCWLALAEQREFIFRHVCELLQTNSLLAPAFGLVTDIDFLETSAVLFGRYAAERDLEAVAGAVDGKKLRVLQAIKRAVLRGNSLWVGATTFNRTITWASAVVALRSQVHTAIVCEELDPQEELRGSLPRLAACYPAQTRDEAERVLCGHREEVLDCVVLGDGRRLVSASFDNTLRVWDSQTGATEHVLKGHETPVVSCIVLKDGYRIVSASWDNTLRVWNTHTGEAE